MATARRSPSVAALAGALIAIGPIIAATWALWPRPVPKAVVQGEVVHPVAVRAFKAAWGLYPPGTVAEGGKAMQLDLIPVGPEGPLLKIASRRVLVSGGRISPAGPADVGRFAVHYFEGEDLTKPVARYVGAGDFGGRAPADVRLVQGPEPALLFTTRWSQDGCVAEFVNVVQLRPERPAAGVYYAGGSLTRWPEPQAQPVLDWTLTSDLSWDPEGFTVAYKGPDSRKVRYRRTQEGFTVEGGLKGLPMCLGA